MCQNPLQLGFAPNSNKMAFMAQTLLLDFGGETQKWLNGKKKP